MNTTHHISPVGTDFMARLQEQLKYFVNSKLSTDNAWKGVNVYLSGHEVRAGGSVCMYVCQCVFLLHISQISPQMFHSVRVTSVFLGD